jgi:SEC-C motif-containing protein
MKSDCPCGSGASYAACCGPLHSGAGIASTALQLMRSRYSAFAVHDEGYLLATWHPSKRPPSVDLEPALEWRRLQIREVADGTEADDTGTVEFVAHYWDPTENLYGRHHEISRFVRQQGRWLYVEAAA